MSIVEEMHSLIEGIVSASEARADGLMSLRHEVVAQQEEARGRIQALYSVRQEAARQQHAGLSQGRERMLRAEGERRSQVQGWLSEVANRRQSLVQTQRVALTRGRERLLRTEEERRSQVQGWLGEIAGDRSAAQIEWRHLAALHGERAGISKARERAEEFSGARDRVFQHLACHPDGLRLTEIEREFGMSRFESNRVVKSLLGDGKAEKRGLLYFAI